MHLSLYHTCISLPVTPEFLMAVCLHRAVPDDASGDAGGPPLRATLAIPQRGGRGPGAGQSDTAAALWHQCAPTSDRGVPVVQR